MTGMTGIFRNMEGTTGMNHVYLFWPFGAEKKEKKTKLSVFRGLPSMSKDDVKEKKRGRRDAASDTKKGRVTSHPMCCTPLS
jgi:hypothetical protein